MDTRAWSLKQPKVLLVDPHPAELERVAEGLRARGFRVVALARYEAAIPLFRAFAPDAVIFAAQAPNFEAVQVARRLRRLGASATPFLFVVDAPDPQLRAFCLLKGQAADVVARPADPVELSLRVSSLLQWRDAVRRESKLLQEARTPTLHDPETGLVNRRYLLALVGHEIRRAGRHGGGFTVAVGTVEPVGLETLGRKASAQALLEVSSALGAALRESDVVARLGPRSFGLLLPGLASEDTPAAGERLRQRVQRIRLELSGAWVGVRAELGMASYPDVLGPPELVLGRAQEALRRERERRRRTAAAPPPVASGGLLEQVGRTGSDDGVRIR